MVRYLSVMLLAIAASCTAAAAQNAHMGTAQQQRACRSDVARFCRGVRGGDFAIADCLKAHRHRLRASCRRVIEGSGE